MLYLVKGGFTDDEGIPFFETATQPGVADLDDPIRYLLVSRMGPRFFLYYNVSDDLFAMNNPSGGTLFKRRKAAESSMRTLGRGIQVVECQSRRRKGARVPLLSSLDKRPKKR